MEPGWFRPTASYMFHGLHGFYRKLSKQHSKYETVTYFPGHFSDSSLRKLCSAEVSFLKVGSSIRLENTQITLSDLTITPFLTLKNRCVHRSHHPPASFPRTPQGDPELTDGHYPSNGVMAGGGGDRLARLPVVYTVLWHVHQLLHSSVITGFLS